MDQRILNIIFCVMVRYFLEFNKQVLGYIEKMSIHKDW